MLMVFSMPPSHTCHEQAFSAWSEDPKTLGRYRPAQAAQDARVLVRWCREKHGGTLVRKRFNVRVCKDKQGHAAMSATLRRLKRAEKGAKADNFHEAFGVMDKAFGCGWRTGERGGHQRVAHGNRGGRRQLIRYFSCYLPCHSVATAHADQRQDGKEEEEEDGDDDGEEEGEGRGLS